MSVQQFENKLIDAVMFWEGFKVYLKEHAPEVFTKNGVFSHHRLSEYLDELLYRWHSQIQDKKEGQRSKSTTELTEFEKMIVVSSITKVPEKCNICGQLGNPDISHLNELIGPRICSWCLTMPEIKEIIRRVDPNESVVMWRKQIRFLF